MARVTDEAVREYQNYCEQLFDAVKFELRNDLSGLNLSDADIRKTIADLVAERFGYYGNASAELGRIWYQNCRDTETDGNGSYVATTYFNDDLYGRLINDVYSIVDRLKADARLRLTEEEAVERISDTVANYVHKVNRDTVVENLNIENEGVYSAPGTPTRVEQRRELRRMKRGRVAYMRVPSSNCACAFCIMMASRGAVYKTRESAGGGADVNKYHINCRCSVVPVSVDDPFIEGYSTDEYEDQYYDARSVWTKKSYSEDVARRIALGKADAERNGRQWKDINEIEIVMRDMYDLH